MFWIHLNVDYPFNLTGVLYFPRIHSNIELQRNKVMLYCNQVFVTDQVEGIVPDFLTLLHGVIDSPDIPLNVSRSYLQSDGDVKKISTYITKKVADRLQSLFKEDRKGFEEKWDSLKLFINYGMLSQEDFYERAKDFALLKDVDGKYFTYDEYRMLVKDNQTNKDGQLVCLYTNNKEEQYSYVEAARAKGYSVLQLEGELDVPVASMLEQKLEKCHFVRVDSDIVERLIQKDDAPKSNIDEADRENLSQVFRSQMPHIDKAEFNAEVEAMGETAQPILITQSEYMRRMKDMSRLQAGMAFYAQMPDAYSVVLNSDHALAALRQQQSAKKPEEITEEERAEVSKTEKEIADQRARKQATLADFGKGNDIVHQLIDLALLQNGLLKGAALDAFLKRSVALIK